MKSKISVTIDQSLIEFLDSLPGDSRGGKNGDRSAQNQEARGGEGSANAAGRLSRSGRGACGERTMGEHNRRGDVDRIIRSEVWTVEPVGFPKPRPAVVVSIDPINDLCPDVLLVPLTTKPGPLRVAISDPARATGLKIGELREMRIRRSRPQEPAQSEDRPHIESQPERDRRRPQTCPRPFLNLRVHLSFLRLSVSWIMSR